MDVSARGSREKNIICYEDIKQAALYFDKVFPIDIYFPLAQSCKLTRYNNPEKKYEINMKFETKHHEEAFSSLILGPDTKRKLTKSELLKLNETRSRFQHMIYSSNFQSTIDDSIKTENLLMEFYIKNPFVPGWGIFRDILKEYANSFGISNTSVLLPSNVEFPKSNDIDDLSLCLLNMNLIDTNKATWEQILEIRKNKKMRNMIKGLRLFLFANYMGKPKSYVEDDINKRIEDYDDAVKQMGMETRLSIIEGVLSSNNLLSIVGTGFLATFIGGPVAGIMTSSILEIGKIAIKIAKRKSYYENMCNEFELSYIIEAQKVLQKSVT